MQINKTNRHTLSVFIAFLLLAIIEFALHRKVVFMMDDLWYSTNLATGNSLASLGDIWASQQWHFHNWGGRVITHGLLQLTLMGGELLCDILNLIMTVLLAGIITILANRKNFLSFFTSFTLLIALNANIKMSMFWQSGAANYIYSTVWILLFLWVYLRQVQTPQVKPLPLVNIWIPFLGLITGWSNENMGPASFVLTIIVILYILLIEKNKIPFWMINGAFFSLVGSALVILAPGNFVRVSCLPEERLLDVLYNRFLSMLCAGTDYLFPTILFTVFLMVIYTLCLKEKLQPVHWMLLLHAILSYGAMVLSPHYPDRATFGTMTVCIVLIVFMLSDILEKHKNLQRYIYLFTGSLWIYALYSLLCEFYLFLPA